MLLIKIYSDDAFSTSLHIWTFIWSNVSQNDQDSQYFSKIKRRIHSFFKLRLGALIPRSVGPPKITKKLQNFTKHYKTFRSKVFLPHTPPPPFR